MRVAVILSTYNWPHALELSLWGYAAQTWRDMQIVVADDGSGPDTAATIERVRAASGLDIVHVWHSDRGFRKNEILNRAILRTDREYLIFSDGDSIPNPRLVETHVRLSQPDRYLAGGYVKLPARVSERITADDVRAGNATRLSWLIAQGFRPGSRVFRWSGPYLGAVLDRITTTPARWHGNNASTWRKHLLAVNGFDASMGYGGGDAALGDRLENLGVMPLRIRHRAPVVHLYHERPWLDPEVMRCIVATRQRFRASGETRAVEGIAELGEPVS